MIYCERCGVANRDGSRFCNGCGVALVLDTPVQEPLPPWLRAAAVANYLWKGDVLLPEWLSQLRPFRDTGWRSTIGAATATLQPAVSDAPAPSTSPQATLSEEFQAEEPVFEDLDDDEEGALESDLMLIDDLELTVPGAELGPLGDPPDEGVPRIEDPRPSHRALKSLIEAESSEQDADAGPSIGEGCADPESLTATAEASIRNEHSARGDGAASYSLLPGPAQPVTPQRMIGLLLRPNGDVGLPLESPVTEARLAWVAEALTESGVPGLEGHEVPSDQPPWPPEAGGGDDRREGGAEELDIAEPSLSLRLSRLPRLGAADVEDGVVTEYAATEYAATEYAATEYAATAYAATEDASRFKLAVRYMLQPEPEIPRKRKGKKGRRMDG